MRKLKIVLIILLSTSLYGCSTASRVVMKDCEKMNDTNYFVCSQQKQIKGH